MKHTREKDTCMKRDYTLKYICRCGQLKKHIHKEEHENIKKLQWLIAWYRLGQEPLNTVPSAYGRPQVKFGVYHYNQENRPDVRLTQSPLKMYHNSKKKTLKKILLKRTCMCPKLYLAGRNTFKMLSLSCQSPGQAFHVSWSSTIDKIDRWKLDQTPWS